MSIARVTTPEAAYRDAGYVLFPAVFDAEAVAAWRAECERLAKRHELFNTADPLLDVRRDAAGRPNPDRIDFPGRVSEPFRRLAEAPRIAALVAGLLGTPGRLFKDKLILKPPGTTGYTLHQDFPYWATLGPPADAMLTLMLAIDPADAATGTIEVYPGRHRAWLPAPPGQPLDTAPEALAGTRPERIDLAAGDVLAFHPLAPHESGPNTTQRPRRALFLSYCAAVHGDLYARVLAQRTPDRR